MSGQGTLLMAVIPELTQLLGYLWYVLLLVVSRLFSLLVSLLPASIIVFLSTVWGIVLVGGLLALATAINLVGGSDVYATLTRRLSRESLEPGDDVDLSDIDETAITDASGQFSASALETVTGLTPSEFIVLFVRVNGGRVNQTTIVRSLPWSKATVSRYLDLLESEGALTRVELGRANVICLPEAVPEGYDSE